MQIRKANVGVLGLRVYGCFFVHEEASMAHCKCVVISGKQEVLSSPSTIDYDFKSPAKQVSLWLSLWCLADYSQYLVG
jgi:hypothetical protein